MISLADFANLGENSKYDWTVVMWSENIRWTNNSSSKYIYSEYFVFKKKKLLCIKEFSLLSSSKKFKTFRNLDSSHFFEILLSKEKRSRNVQKYMVTILKFYQETMAWKINILSFESFRKTCNPEKRKGYTFLKVNSMKCIFDCFFDCCKETKEYRLYIFPQTS